MEHNALKDIPKFKLVTNVPKDYLHLICIRIYIKTS